MSQTLAARPSLFNKLLRSPWTVLGALGRAIRWTGVLIAHIMMVFCRWLQCGFLLTQAASRKIFTPPLMLVSLLVFIFWIFSVLDPRATEVRIFIPALLLSILFSMNVLPREKEAGTVEAFFSLPVSRYRLVVWQLVAIAFWLLVLLLPPLVIWSLVVREANTGPFLLYYYPSLLVVSCLTIWLSTLTRSASPAGFLAVIICGLQLFYPKSFGPVQLFVSPFNEGLSQPWGVAQLIQVGILFALLMVMINQRLKRSELWL